MFVSAFLYDPPRAVERDPWCWCCSSLGTRRDLQPAGSPGLVGIVHLSSGIKVNLRVDLNLEAVVLNDFLVSSDLLPIRHCTTEENPLSLRDS